MSHEVGDTVMTEIDGETYRVQIRAKSAKDLLVEETEIPDNFCTEFETVYETDSIFGARVKVTTTEDRCVWKDYEFESVIDSPWEVLGVDGDTVTFERRP